MGNSSKPSTGVNERSGRAASVSIQSTMLVTKLASSGTKNRRYCGQSIRYWSNLGIGDVYASLKRCCSPTLSAWSPWSLEISIEANGVIGVVLGGGEGRQGTAAQQDRSAKAGTSSPTRFFDRSAGYARAGEVRE